MALLTTNNLSFTYQKQIVLKNINLSINAGSILTILGPNGVGKSTLLSCLVAQLPLAKQTIYLDGQDLTSLKHSAITKKIAFMPQKYQITNSLTVMDFITTARVAYLKFYQIPTKKDEALAAQVLKKLNIYSLRNCFVNTLSGGQMQLVALAKALVQEPKLLILDEPLAALDFGYQQLILKKLKDLASQGMAIMITTHTPNHALFLNDQVGLLYPDHQFLIGNCAEIMTTANLEQLYHCQLKVFTTPELDYPLCEFL
ncbi:MULTISPECIES: ABC transporter ATP-binding protein [Lactobacillus]|uniref:ABC transporter ATP-binding protein n=1 Tax=Lactobacillus xujianguonis TaxID=2495899 RepID=A0A437SVN0_9LACO|nr:MULTISPECIES: ABC transporter ATP-binding protein [Lactobacillus]RVU70981.1 ABC transporter ATP-binding protein [Lactobacillus xujianguonis]RVU73400.1 ABC transporter ATP-binding protein [Lactobacillus xujianguonis]